MLHLPSSQTMHAIFFVLALTGIVSSLKAQSLDLTYKQVSFSDNVRDPYLIDTDGDGEQEIVGVNSKYIFVYEIEEGKKLRTKWISENFGINDQLGDIRTMTVGSLKEGDAEKMILCTAGSKLLVFNAQSKELEKKVQIERRNYRKIRFFDVGEDRLVFLTSTVDGQPGYLLTAFDLNTETEIWRSSVYRSGFYQMIDLDGDGLEEVLYGTDSIYSYNFTAKETELIFDRRSDLFQITDLNQDGSQDLVTVDQQGIYLYNYPQLTLRSYRPKLWYIPSNIECLDINLDGVLETFVSTSTGIICYDVENDIEIWDEGDEPSDIIFYQIDENYSLIHTGSLNLENESNFHILDGLTGDLIWTDTIPKFKNHVFMLDYDGDQDLEVGVVQDISADFQVEGSQLRVYESSLFDEDKRLFDTQPRWVSGLPPNYTNAVTGRFIPSTDREQILVLDRDHIESRLLVYDHGEKVSDRKIISSGGPSFLYAGNLDQDQQLEILTTVYRQLSTYDLDELSPRERNTVELSRQPSKVRTFDINGDGIDEISVILDNGDYLILDPASLQVMYQNTQYHFRDCAYGDIDGDGDSEILLNVDNQIEFVALHALDEDLERIDFPDVDKSIVNDMVLFDLDPAWPGDEVIVLYDSLYVFSIDSNRYEITKGRYGGEKYQSYATSIVVGDLDANQKQDISFGTREGVFVYEYSQGVVTNTKQVKRTPEIFKILSNPIKSELHIRFIKDLADRAEIYLYDNSGRVIYNRLLGPMNVGQELTLNNLHMSPGIHYISIVSKSTQDMKSFVRYE